MFDVLRWIPLVILVVLILVLLISNIVIVQQSKEIGRASCRERV